MTLSLTAAALGASTPAAADFYFHSWEPHREFPQQFGLGLDLGSYTTGSNFDPNGTVQLPQHLYGYSRIEGDVRVSYGILESLTAYARFTWARAAVDSDTLPGNSFGPGDQTLGVSFRALGDGPTEGRAAAAVTALYLQGQADLPAYDVQSASANQIPWMGDGSADLTIGALGSLDFGRGRKGDFVASGGLGYTYRTGNYTTPSFSMSVPWSAAVDYVPAREGLRASLGAHGLVSLHNDPRGDPTISPAASVGSAGSLVTNAIDPTLLALRGMIGFQTLDGIELLASVDKAVAGFAAPNGLAIWATIQFHLGPSPSLGAHRERPPLAPNDKSNSGFIDYAFEAKVARVNDRLNLVRIDKGKGDGVELGQTYDIFSVKPDGSVGEAVARAQVTAVHMDEAALTITEYFREVWIEPGFLAKRPLQ